MTNESPTAAKRSSKKACYVSSPRDAFFAPSTPHLFSKARINAQRSLVIPLDVGLEVRKLTDAMRDDDAGKIIDSGKRASTAAAADVILSSVGPDPARIDVVQEAVRRLRVGF